MTIHLGDCIEVMRTLPEASVDAVVTDPPAGISFMGKDWDHHRGGRDLWVAWMTEVMRECYRLLKPGGHALVWALPRTSHWTAWALDGAGFEVRDRLIHCFASGFPKSLDVSRAIDKANGKYDRDLDAFGRYVRERRTEKGWSLRQLDEAMGTNTSASWWEGRKSGVQPPSREMYHRLKVVLGMDDRYDELIEWVEAEREVIGRRTDVATRMYDNGEGPRMPDEIAVTAPATDAARKWDGWGTALKPAYEDWWLARKPLRGTVAANVQEFGTGALNIGGCRIGTTKDVPASGSQSRQPGYGMRPVDASMDAMNPNLGRWPANVLLTATDDGRAIFDGGVEGVVGGGERLVNKPGPAGFQTAGYDGGWGGHVPIGYGDTGTYSRFFLVPKSSRSDREPVVRGQIPETQTKGDFPALVCNICGCRRVLNYRPTCGHDDFRREVGQARANSHPTVKSTELMRHLVRLVTPPKVNVLECVSCGSSPSHRPNVSAVRPDVSPSSTGDILLEHLPSTVQREPKEALPDMRNDVPGDGGVGEATTEVLLEGVRKSGRNTEAQALRGMPDSVSAGDSGESILLKEMRDEGSGAQSSELDARRQWLHPGVESTAPERGAEWVRDATPQSDGGDPRTTTDSGRSSASPQSPQRRQPSREPRTVEQVSSRQPAEAAPQADHLPSLPVDDLPLGACPSCGGRLAAGVKPGLVLDPFAGSGSTLIAAEQEGFAWIGIEKEAEYIAIIEARLNGTQRGLGLDVEAPTKARKSVDGVAVNRNRPEKPAITSEPTSYGIPMGRSADVTYRKPRPVVEQPEPVTPEPLWPEEAA